MGTLSSRIHHWVHVWNKKEKVSVSFTPSEYKNPTPLLYVFITAKMKTTTETTFGIFNGRWKGKVSFASLALYASWALSFVSSCSCNTFDFWFLFLVQGFYVVFTWKDKGSSVGSYILDLSLYLLNSISELLSASCRTQTIGFIVLLHGSGWLNVSCDQTLCWY